jgi:hypothetical protein
MILSQAKDITDEALKRTKELKESWASQEEINVVISEALFRIDVLINWIPYHLMQQ